jgi:hypothetical protein
MRRWTALPFSKKIGAAAWEVLWKLAAKSPEVILESNFRPNSPVEQARLAALKAQIVEVHCHCPPEEIVRRYAIRDAAGERHYAHALSEITAEQLAQFNGWMGFGTLIEVDTSHPVNVPALARRINNLWNGNFSPKRKRGSSGFRGVLLCRGVVLYPSTPGDHKGSPLHPMNSQRAEKDCPEIQGSLLKISI